MTWTEIIDLLSLLSGIAYILLEIGQKNAMWVVGILTGAACATSFAFQHAWASMGLNLYYIGMSVWGLLQWRRDDAAAGEAGIHLREMSSAARMSLPLALVFATPLLAWVLRLGADPAPWLDGAVFVMSMIGTWWLAKAYPQQWLLWIVADILSTSLCVVLGNWLLVALYAAYTLSAVYGYFHWIKKGKQIV